MGIRARCTTPEAIKKLNGWLTWLWVANVPLVIAAYLLLGERAFERATLLYLAVISVWANIASHFAAWIAGRVEVNQDT